MKSRRKIFKFDNTTLFIFTSFISFIAFIFTFT